MAEAAKYLDDQRGRVLPMYENLRSLSKALLDVGQCMAHSSHLMRACATSS